MIKEFTLNDKKHFLLSADRISCLLCIDHGQVLMLHLGAAIKEADAAAFGLRTGPGWGASIMYEDICLDCLPLAWSSGLGDYRELPQDAEDELSFSAAETGKFDMTLPHAEAEETLKITMEGKIFTLELYFSVFEAVLTRHARLINKSGCKRHVKKLMSAMADIKGDFSISTFDGGWISETHEHTIPVSYSRIVNESSTGFSSNRHNPGFILSDGSLCFGFNLIYSGAHYSSVQRSKQNLVRVMQGINPSDFDRSLMPGEAFETPEAVICFSDEGRNGLRRNMHDFINRYIIPPYWRFKERPVLYNSWEGCMFDFDERRLLSLAKKAKELGCELFVLDDGWFKNRNSDNAGLGDYDVDRKKTPSRPQGTFRPRKKTENGLRPLVRARGRESTKQALQRAPRLGGPGA